MISDSAALLELSTVLNASTDLDFILGNVLLTLMGKLVISRGAVLVEAGLSEYRLRTMKGLTRKDIDSSFHLRKQWSGIQEIATLLPDKDSEIAAFALCCQECGIAFIQPIILHGRMVGIIGLGEKLTHQPVSSEEATFLESIAAVASTAVQNALTIDALQQVNRKLDAKIQEMNTLFELSREMNTTFDPQSILRVLRYALMGQLRVMRYIVFAYDGEQFAPVLINCPDFHSDKTYHEQLLALENMFTPDKVENCPEAITWLRRHTMEVIIPMRLQSTVRGVLCVGERLGGAPYDKPELEFLNALANITITALENARLVQDTIEKQRLEQELDLARSIQKGLLPKSIPDVEGYSIAAINESSQQVGGDYYDIIPLSDHEYLLAIGDVSGKGIPASLLMANAQAAIRMIAPLRLPLPEATERMNTVIYANTGADKFITFFWGVLNTRDHTFEYVNAGHNPPYLLHPDGSYEPLTAGGLILGVLEIAPAYESGLVRLDRGDTIITFTDGVNEAMSIEMKIFGDDRLLSLLTSNTSLSPQEIIDTVKRAILDFTKGEKQSDDITMLVAQRTG
jgi:phosphoserine phosphatase RsbU/P